MGTLNRQDVCLLENSNTVTDTRNTFKQSLTNEDMKQFIGGLVAGVGIGLLVCGLVASTLVSDFEYTLRKYEREIDDFYEFTHSYGFETIQDLISQTTGFYTATPPLRQALETFGMGQLGQLLQDIDGNLEKTIDISEDMYNARSTVKEAQSWILYLEVGGIVLIIAGCAVAAWAMRQS